MPSLEQLIDELYGRIGEVHPEDAAAREVVEQAITMLDDGSARVAEVDAAGDVVVHEWLKRAILLFFKVRGIETQTAGPFEYADRLPLKHDYEAAGVRVVPAPRRAGAYLAPGVILMPATVELGARVGARTLVDTWATVASCAQIGEDVHLSGGVGIGGVLEPVGAVPVVVEDGAFIGSRSMIVGGARVGRDAVVGAGTILTASIPVIDATTGEELSHGRVPDRCVAVGASRRRDYPGGEFFLPCVLVVRHLAEGERHNQATLNDVLRAHDVAT